MKNIYRFISMLIWLYRNNYLSRVYELVVKEYNNYYAIETYKKFIRKSDANETKIKKELAESYIPVIMKDSEEIRDNGDNE